MITSAADVQKVLARHGFTCTEAAPAAVQGAANDTWIAGDWVVRFLKDSQYESDAYTESVAVPAARAAGIPTPRLIILDDSKEIWPAVVTVYERWPGTPASQAELAPTFGAEWGELIADVQNRIRNVPDPNRVLTRPGPWPTREALKDLEEAGYSGLAPWRKWAERLETAWTGHDQVFLHWDMKLDNLLVYDRGHLSAVLDWGDAGWGDPALDFGAIPPTILAPAVERYQTVRPTDETFEGRVLSEVASRALDQFARQMPNLLTDLLMFTANPPNDRWRRWGPEAPLPLPTTPKFGGTLPRA